MILLKIPPHKQIKFLIGAPQFNIGFQLNRVHRLSQGIQKLMNGDGHPTLVPFFKIIALQHAGNGVSAGQTDHIIEVHGTQPL